MRAKFADTLLIQRNTINMLKKLNAT